MRPEPAQFTKDNPVRKTDLWRCFRRSSRGFATVQVDEAHSIVGKNAPRYMEAKGYLLKQSGPAGDFYKLTADGETWLTRGIESYVKNHPAERDTIAHLPGAAPSSRVIRRRR